MANFRKCLLAFALVALLAGLASAQSALQCTVNASVTPTVRAEGLAELLGDVVLNCTGGTPTTAGQPIPTANVVIYTTVPLTSRIVSYPFTEVLLLIDDPHTTTNASPLTLCDPTGANAGVCPINGITNVLAAGTNGGVGTVGPYNGATAARPNVFQSRITGTNQVTFFGVPIDPPGTTGTRVIRVTNLRGNANYLGASTSLVPQTIVANISVSPSNLLPLNNPQQTVAYIQKGLTTSTTGTLKTFVQCNDENPKLAASPSATVIPDQGSFSVVFTEGFPAAWKEKNIAIHLANQLYATVAPAYPGDVSQDVPGANYYSESGFLANGTAPSPLSAPSGYGPFLATNGSFASGATGQPLAGKADQGTRLIVNFDSVPSGTQLFVPAILNLTVPVFAATSPNYVSGIAVLVSTDANGAGTYTRAGFSSANGLAQITITSGSGVAVYEILYTNPNQSEQLSVPVTVAYAANQGNNLPAPGVTSTVAGNFAPLSTVTTYDITNTAPIPRFAKSNTPASGYTVVKCSCNILFPWVVYTQGYDTGIAIANTSADPWGDTPQAGAVTINYYTSGTAPAAQTTTSTVPAGAALVFTLSGGGNYGIGGISSGFAGYIIAQAQFQYCHAYAYISSFGALPSSPGTSEGYLGIVLDKSGLNRTGQAGEVQGH
jgi:hypothetical protein